MKKQYKKLVRDMIPAVVARDGAYAKTRTLGVAEFKKELLKKLLEEAAEVQAAVNKKELVKELADVCEVVLAVQSAFSISAQEVERERKKKIKDRGGFKKKIFLEYIE